MKYLYVTLNPPHFCGSNSIANTQFYTSRIYYRFFSPIPTVEWIPIQGPAVFKNTLEEAKQEYLDIYNMYKIEAMKDFSQDFLPHKGFFYIDVCDSGLNYWVLSPDEKIQQGSLTWDELPKKFPRQEDDILKLCFIDKNYSHLFAQTALKGHTLNPKDAANIYQKVIFELEVDESRCEISAFSRCITYKGTYLHPRRDRIIHLWAPENVSWVNSKDLAAINALYKQSLNPQLEIPLEAVQGVLREDSFVMIN